MTEAHKSWNRLIDEVVTTGIPVTLTRYGKPVAVLVPYGWHQRRHTLPSEPSDVDVDEPKLRPSARLTPQVVARAVKVFHRHSATDIRIVGSVAKGTDHLGSDIDFLTQLPATFSLFRLVELEGDLEQVIGCPVDVISDDPRGGAALDRLRADAKPFASAAEIAYRLTPIRAGGTDLLDSIGMPADNPVPIHPGDVLQALFLSALGISWQALAACSGAPIQEIIDLVDCRRSIDAVMASALARGLGTTTEFWVNLQREYDQRITESSTDK